ncbi:alpha-1-antitrypsin [Alligator mississippiensis]|uniref:alpha-1-antitrypsin n=1 Tax=Alligator mississippiensis TaxID=8496 RepID=UPI0028778D04|nr:alpha-1-antitrypsin [Alligator mississippiensis]
MKSTLSFCLLLVGYCILCHHVPGHQDYEDGQEELNPPEEHFQAEGNVTGENMLCHKIAPSNADFAFRFYRQATSAAEGKNVFFSPLGISAAFAMLVLGAKSATRNQILEALTFNLTEIEEKEIHDGFHHLIQLLNSPDREIQLSMGNAPFVDVHLNLLQKFVDDVKKFYDSKVFTSNFEDPEHLAKAEKQINDYIKNKTQGKITNLVKDLNQDTLLVLVNYIFFKAHWEDPFNPDSTREGHFFLDDGTSVEVKMMNRDGGYKTYHDKQLSCTVVQIPYKGNAFALFVLPDKRKMEEVEDALSKKTLFKWKKIYGRVDFFISVFSVSGTYELKDFFMKLGVAKVFSNQADLSGITQDANLKMSRAVHKAMLNVYENGTEAAAATFLEIVADSLSPTIEFNRPFLMMIVDQATNSILFMGKIMNPTEK